MSNGELYRQVEKALEDFIAGENCAPVWNDRKVVIYGAGEFGRDLARALHREPEVALLGFLDQKGIGQPIFDGLGSHPLGSAAANQWLAERPVVMIGAHNNRAKLRDIKTALKSAGFEDVLTPMEVYQRLGSKLGWRFWLGKPKDYQGAADAIHKLRPHWADERSERLYLETLLFRISFDLERVSEPAGSSIQYCDPTVPRWKEPLHMVDGGAYTGDSFEQMHAAGYKFESIYAFEPDAENFTKLTTASAKFAPRTKVSLWPCGLWSSTRRLHFAEGDGTSSKITDVGNSILPVVALDEVLHGIDVNLLKFDIEGAELDALKGSQKIIERCHPGLAMCLYHHPEHLWSIPLWIASVYADYRFYYRAYEHNTWETCTLRGLAPIIPLDAEQGYAVKLAIDKAKNNAMNPKIAIFASLVASLSLSPSAQAQSFLTNGLIALYPFDGNARDYTTNAHNGNLFGTTAFAPDRFGNPNSCLALSGGQGIGSGVDIPSLANMSYYPATYTAWCLVSNFPATTGDLIVMTLIGREQCGQQTDGSIDFCTVQDASGDNHFNYFTGGTGTHLTNGTPTNQWFQLAVTISSNGALTMYVNGTNMPMSGPGTAVQGVSEDFRIGASSGGGCSYEYVWNGLIDDVRIYNRALSNSEVLALYQYESPPCLNEPAFATAIVTNGFVIGVTLQDGGCGFTNAPQVAFVGGAGTGAAGYAVISNGVVTGVNITDAGIGYVSPPQVIIGESPSIVTEPASTNVDANTPAYFSVAAIGTSSMSYQWLFDGSNVAGAISNMLTFSNVVQTNLGSYSVVISNIFGSVTSSVAVLGMYPYLNQTFAGLETDWGYTNTLSVGAWGTGPLTYQWYFDGSAISGATSSNLTLSAIQFTNAGLYSVVVSDALGSVTNTPEQVVVNPSGVAIGLSPTITISGVVGYNYAIQRNSDLSNTNTWVTITNLTLTQPVQIWADTSINVAIPGSSQQFYRVLPAH